MFGLGDNIFASGNHDSLLGNVGKQFQKYTDPLAWIGGDKYVNLTSVEIPRLVNTGLSKVMQPFEKVDKTINPVRRYVPGVDQISNVIADKPGSAIGTVVGGMFAAPAIGSALGAGGAGGGGAALGGAGGGEAALGGAAGYGGGVGSSVLPGIFEGGSVAPTFGGGGFFGGSAAGGSLTGTSAPLFSSGGLLGSGGAGLFGGNGLSQQQYGQLINQGIRQLQPDQNQGTIQTNQQYQQTQRPTATVTPNSSYNAALARYLMGQ